MAKHQTLYRLRNHPQRAFAIEAEVRQHDPSQAVIAATIREGEGPPFLFEVEFGGPFLATKEHFTDEMLLHTALSIVTSQLESLQHRPTRLRVHQASGLIHTEPLAG